MFLDTPIESLGREICQNSGDARKNKNKPVEVEFKTFEINTDELPDIEKLRDAINRGEDFWKSQNNPKADKFYAAAKAIIESDKITILRISDHNTWGLSGVDQPDNTNMPWTALVMSEGASSKDGTGGGSFGIGKFAAFANSKIRTVFYSTLDSTGKQASQGLSILASFIDEKGSKTFGEGYCGTMDSKESTSPVYDQIHLDESFNRKSDDFGTDIYVLGFDSSGNWKNQLVAAILNGFLYAIDQDMMKVTVDDVVIDRNTLDDVISKYRKDCNDFTYDYYQILRSDNEWITFDDFDGNKDCMHLKLMVAPGLHRHVAMVRQTGMKILDRNRINGQIYFAGFLYVDGEKANKYLTSLENPAHKDWLVERDSNQGHAKQYLIHMNRRIRDELQKLVNQNFGGEINLQMDNMLQSIDVQEGDKEKRDVLTDETEEIKTRKHELRDNGEPYEADAEGTNPDEGDIGEGGGKDHGDSGSGGPGIGYGSGTGGNGQQGGMNPPGSGDDPGQSDRKKNRGVVLKTRRLVATDVLNGKYSLALQTEEACSDSVIDIGIAAEDAVYSPVLLDVSIKGQPNISFSGNRITGVELYKDKKVFIDLRLADTRDYVSLEVKCYENPRQ